MPTGVQRPADDLRGRTVVLVGASSGIGRAAALAFADAGAVLVLAARDATALEEVGDQVRDRGAEALTIPLDVTDANAVEALADEAVARFGHLDVWVHAASALSAGDVTEVPAGEAERLLAVNILGYVNGARAALRTFRAQDRGTLVLVSSLLGVLPNAALPLYVTSRFAVRGLGLSLRQAVAEQPGIDVCTLLPGPVDTPIYDRAANRTGRQLRAIPPALAPERAAAAVVRCARRPVRERTTSATHRLALVGHRLLPRTVERLASGWSARLLTTREAARGDAGALFDPPADARTAGDHRRGALRRRLGAAWGAWLADRETP